MRGRLERPLLGVSADKHDASPPNLGAALGTWAQPWQRASQKAACCSWTSSCFRTGALSAASRVSVCPEHSAARSGPARGRGGWGEGRLGREGAVAGDHVILWGRTLRRRTHTWPGLLSSHLIHGRRPFSVRCACAARMQMRFLTQPSGGGVSSV